LLNEAATMPDPRANIIISNFNYARFLGEAIDSALGQTWANSAVIVVDDGSTDDSREVLTRYGTDIITVLKPNGGQGSAYNAGWAASQSDLVCFLDADDTLFPNAMEVAVSLFEDPAVVKVQWPLHIVDHHGNWHGEVSTKASPPEGDLKDRVVSEGPLYDFHYTTGSAYRADFLNQVFPMPEAPYRNGGDVYLITLAPVYGRIRTSAQALGTYRAHGSNNYRERSLDDKRIENYLQRFEDNSHALSTHLARQHIQADTGRWKRRNFNYLWLKRLLLAKKDIAALVQPGGSYILVNDDEWGGPQPVEGRHAIPFLERSGAYWGPPTDDAEAIDELERFRRQGARFLVFWWTSFWWLDHYVRLNEYLHARFPCSLHNDRLMVFDIANGEGGRQAATG
jgi:glycosyltransferase involved in cell wall biosynthesis